MTVILKRILLTVSFPYFSVKLSASCGMTPIEKKCVKHCYANTRGNSVNYKLYNRTKGVYFTWDIENVSDILII